MLKMVLAELCLFFSEISKIGNAFLVKRHKEFFDFSEFEVKNQTINFVRGIEEIQNFSGQKYGDKKQIWGEKRHIILDDFSCFWSHSS